MSRMDVLGLFSRGTVMYAHLILFRGIAVDRMCMRTRESHRTL